MTATTVIVSSPSVSTALRRSMSPPPMSAIDVELAPGPPAAAQVAAAHDRDHPAPRLARAAPRARATPRRLGQVRGQRREVARPCARRRPPRAARPAPPPSAAPPPPPPAAAPRPARARRRRRAGRAARVTSRRASCRRCRRRRPAAGRGRRRRPSRAARSPPTCSASDSGPSNSSSSWIWSTSRALSPASRDRARASCTIATLMMSAAVPWITVLTASRSPSWRMWRWRARSSGMRRLRPNSVVT